MRILLAVLLAVSVAACAAGNLVPQSPASPLPGVKGEARERVSILIHVPKREKHGTRARYVSRSTKGVTIALSGPTNLNETLGLTPRSPGCLAGPNGTTCRLAIFLQSCPSSARCYSASVATYDSVKCAKTCTIPSSAKRLSADQNAAFNVAAGKSNSLRLTLDGVPASVAIVPGSSSTLTGDSVLGFTIPKCVTTPQPVTLTALDADGNTIVGPGAPGSPQLASDDAIHLAVAAPKPSASPNAFTLVPPASLASATIPNAGTVVHLTATVRPLAGSGSTKRVSSKISVTFNTDVCGVITEYSNGLTTAAGLAGITVGSDNNLWFVEDQYSTVGSITTGGTITEHGVTSSHNPAFFYAITKGPDGNLWFTESDAPGIGTYTTGGTYSEYLQSGGGVYGITTGPDGNLWYTGNDSHSVSHVTAINTAGQIQHSYSVPTHAMPFGIVTGPDGALWFADSNTNSIGRITTNGTVGEYSVPTANSDPSVITSGPDGALWFAEECTNKIGRITTAGVVTNEYPVPTASAFPGGSDGINGMTSGPDGAVWFVESLGNKIGRITTGGTITEYPVPTASSHPEAIVSGPDGALWFTEGTASAQSKIGRIQ